jgi:HD-GYP domain-containing protein (c-di-GMP phosphodiesterase class II)
MSEELALDELRRNAGIQFDPVVVAAFSAEQRAQRDTRHAVRSPVGA